jgi:cardiolipin synthase
MNPRFLDGNRVQLLRNGEAYFPALVQAIDSAKQGIFLETYIFADDETGRLIAAALARAAGRGVTVRVLADGFGSKDMLKGLRQQLLANQVRLMIYHPKISPFTLRRNRLRRLHRKLVVIDGRVAFAGGINVIDDQHTPGGLMPPRYDYAVRIEGPLSAMVLSETVRLWNRIAWINFRWQWRSRYQPVHESAAVAGHQRVALVVRDNLRHRSDIEDAYLEAFAQAKGEIMLANAYFFPGQRFRQALVAAVGRGVRVRLLLQGRQEYLLLYYATRALYGALLDAGVEIYEYHKSFMHAKVAVIDRRWATVGSSNIDPFSLLLAREANVIVDDPGFAEELRTSLQDHIEDGATVVAKTEWYRQPLWRRVIIWSAYGFARLLLGLVGHDGKH